MASSSWPSPDTTREITDQQYEQLAGVGFPCGVAANMGGTSVVYADNSARKVIIRAGKYATVRGHVWYSGTSTTDKTVAANSSGNPRIDLVVLRLTRATWNVAEEIVQGTPGATPVPPALTQDAGTTGVWEEPLATVNVANGAATIAAADVTDVSSALGGGRYLANQTLAADSASVTFRYIPTRLRAVRLYSTTRSTYAAAYTNLLLRINDVSSNVYHGATRDLYNDTSYTSKLEYQTSAMIGWIPAASATNPATFFGQTVTTFIGWDRSGVSGMQCSMISNSGFYDTSTNYITGDTQFRMGSPGPYTSITVMAANGSLVAGSEFTIEGVG